MQRWRDMLVCFLVATAAAWLASLLRQPLGRLFSEEYFELAQVLSSTGSLESFHRPPGFIAFLSILGFLNPALLGGHYLFAYLVQGVVHGLTAAIIREELGSGEAATSRQLIALAYALSPVALINVGFMHYDTLHVFLLVLSAAACRRALSNGSRVRDAQAAGVVVAVLALVRPMTLPWPLMLLGLALVERRENRRTYALKAGLLLLGFGLTLAPFAARNFFKTGHVILVNAQTGAALWPMTEVELQPDSAVYSWVPLWRTKGRPLVAERFPNLSLERDPFLTDTLNMNRFFLERSYENLSRAPMRYVRNVGRNAWFFLSGNQGTYVHVVRTLNGSSESSLHPVRLICIIAIEGLAVIAGLTGLIVCIVRKRSACLAVGSLLVCLWAVHSALYLDFRYLYVRTPLCLLIAGIALFGPDAGSSPWLSRARAIVPGILFTGSLVAFVATFF
jgi:hypothetical protein